MKIYSNRADKNVDCIRTSMRTEKHNSLHVTLNFRRTVGVPVTMEEETGSEVKVEKIEKVKILKKQQKYIIQMQ